MFIFLEQILCAAEQHQCTLQLCRFCQACQSLSKLTTSIKRAHTFVPPKIGILGTLEELKGSYNEGSFFLLQAVTRRNYSACALCR